MKADTEPTIAACVIDGIAAYHESHGLRHAPRAELCRSVAKSLWEPTVRPDLRAPLSEQIAEELTGACMSYSRTEPAGILKISFHEGELLRLPADYVKRIESARELRLQIECCLGGDCNAAIRILDLAGPKFAVVRVNAYAASAAGFLVASCPGRRVMSRDAELMLHPPVMSVHGGSREHQVAADLLKGTTTCMIDRLTARCGQPRATVERWFAGGDFHFTAEQALANGLMDEIISPAACLHGGEGLVVARDAGELIAAGVPQVSTIAETIS